MSFDLRRPITRSSRKGSQSSKPAPKPAMAPERRSIGRGTEQHAGGNQAVQRQITEQASKPAGTIDQQRAQLISQIPREDEAALPTFKDAFEFQVAIAFARRFLELLEFFV